MSVKNKTSLKTAKVWQRHALAQACFMVTAGLSTAALAVNATPGASFNEVTADVGQSWFGGYNAPLRLNQFGIGQVTLDVNGDPLSGGILSGIDIFSNVTGGLRLPVNINNNSLLVYSYGNQNAGANDMSLANLAMINANQDGQLALNLQKYSALSDGNGGFVSQSALALTKDSSLYITQSGKPSAPLSLSGNSVTAMLILNTVDTTLAGATAAGYTSTTQGLSDVTYGDTNSAGTASVWGTSGSVNLSNLQTTFNTYGTAKLDDVSAKITVKETVAVAGVSRLSDNISLNNNSFTASNTNNAATSVFDASAASSAFTGSVSVTNIQATKISDSSTQLANVSYGDIKADLRNTTATESLLTGGLNVNANTVSAKLTGNAAGARNSAGNIMAGNAILFEGSADITGSTAPKALGASGAAHMSSITSGSATGKADLLVNSVQRNSGNTFAANVDTSVMYAKVDKLDGGSINQNDNTQAVTASANLAGNLISAGALTSIGSIVANAAVINTQANAAVDVTASVQDSSQSVTVGAASSDAAINGNVNVNGNNITAAVEGNASTSTLVLKASNLTVGGNGDSTVQLVPSATGAGVVARSGLAASVLSLQKNDGVQLTSSNEGNSISAKFNNQLDVPASRAISGSQVNLNNNNLLSSAAGNSASNGVTLNASNATGLNAGLGNSQYINNASEITANAGFDASLSVEIAVANVSASAVSMNGNTQSATAKANTANNAMSVTAANASGLDVIANGMFSGSKPLSEASDANGAGGVKTNADFALANAQADSGSTIKGALVGSSKITTGSVSDASTLSANSNNLTTSGSVNTAGNALSLNIGNMNGMVAGLSSAQSTANSVASASTTGEVSLNTAVVTSSSLTLNSNKVSASASANTVTNSLDLIATTAAGRDINLSTPDAGTTWFNEASASIASGKASVAADFALSNNQKITATSLDFAARTVSGINAVTGTLIDSSLGVNNNNTLASVSGNNASNSINLAVSTLSKPNTGLSSLQTMGSTASFMASVNDASDLVATGVASGAANNAQVSVDGNTVKASALGNVASNSIALTGTNVTGSDVAFNAPVVSTDVAGQAVNASATVALASLQTSNGNAMTANLGDLAASQIALVSGAVSNASSLSATGNAMATQVYNNSANNSVALNATNLNKMTAGLASGQSVTASGAELKASTTGLVKIDTDAVSGGSSLTGNNNALSALVVGNSAGNSLSVTATSASGRNTSPGESAFADANNTLARVDFALVSEQAMIQSVLNATTQGAVKINTNEGAITDSAATLNANSLTSYASANNVSNALSLATANLSAATAGLVNKQQLNTSVDVPTTVTATTQGSEVAVSAGNLSAAQISLMGNTVKAMALGNEASNQFSVIGTNVTAGTVNLDNANTQTPAAVDAGLAMVSQQDSFNAQIRSINGTALDPNNIKVSLGAVGSASNVALSNNTVSATSYTNNVTNGMSLTVTNLTGMTAGLASGQYATAVSEKTTAQTVGNITADMSSVSGASNVTLSGNAITASSNVNHAGNSLQIQANQISGRNAIDPQAYANDSARVNADLSLANRQYTSGDGDLAAASVTGRVYANGNGGDLSASSLSVNANSVIANVNGSNANNALGVNASGLTKASLGLASGQYTEWANLKSEVVADIGVDFAAMSGGNLTVNGNQIKASSVGNTAGNTLGLAVTNATGADGIFVVTANAGATSTVAQAYADFGMANSQTLANSAIEAKTGVMGDAPVTVGLKLSDSTSGSAAVSLNANTLAANAYANSASNAGTVRASTLDNFSIASANAQSATDTNVSAKTHGRVFADIQDVTGSNVAANGNQIASLAMTNFATNSLDVNATTMTARSQAPATGLTSREVNADMALANTQVMSGAPVAALTHGELDLSTNGGAVNNGSLSMNTNAVTAYASGNQAANSMGLAVTNLNAATAGLLSVQSLASGSTVGATTTGEVSLSAGNITAQSNVNLNGNLIKSTALGNFASNQLLLTGSNAQSSATLSGSTINGDNSAADLTVANFQNANASAVSAITRQGDSPTSRYQLQMTVSGIDTGTASVNNNAIAALGYVNNAVNTLGMGVTNSGNLNAAVVNLQKAEDAANASASALGQVSLLASAAVDTASLAVNGNVISGAAYSNSSTNTLVVTGTEVVGRGVTDRLVRADTNIAYPALLKTDFALANSQYSNTSSTADTQGGVAMTTGSNSVDSSSLSLNSNSITAYASSNAATNQLDMTATRLSQASAGLASIQSGQGANVTATVDGSVGMTAGAVASGTLSANNNTIKSTALGNVASNALNLTGNTVTSTGSGLIEASAAMDGRATVSADLGLSNSQTQTGAMSASTTGTVNIQASGAVSDSTLSLSANSIKSTAQANSASIASRQANTGAVSATTTTPNGAFGIAVTDVANASANASLMVSDNTVSAVAGKNEAFNTLTVSGANLLGRAVTPVTNLAVGTSSVSGAAFAVMNEQAAASDVTASVNAGASGVSISGPFTGGTVAMSGNTVLASANANTAANTLSLAATNSLEASGVVNNVQSLAGSANISATVETSSALSVDAGASGNAVAVTGNLVKAAASANVATNVLNASASNNISNSSGTTGTPTFAVLNSQHTGSGSSVSSAINGFNMGGTQINGALNGSGSVPVMGNVVQSVAYGNSATNAVQVSALPAGMNTASASITNVQYNLASISSSISGVSVQGSGVNTSGTAGVNISGNSIVAMAVGNRAVNAGTGR